MKVLINQDDAGFLRNMLQAVVLSSPSFERETRRKIARLKDKLSASRGLWSGYSMKQREVITLHLILGKTIKSLDTEIAALLAEPAPQIIGDPVEGETKPVVQQMTAEEKATRLNQLELHKQYAVSVAEKLTDTLTQEVGQAEYISQSVHKENDLKQLDADVAELNAEVAADAN